MCTAGSPHYLDCAHYCSLMRGIQCLLNDEFRCSWYRTKRRKVTQQNVAEFHKKFRFKLTESFGVFVIVGRSSLVQNRGTQRPPGFGSRSKGNRGSSRGSLRGHGGQTYGQQRGGGGGRGRIAQSQRHSTPLHYPQRHHHSSHSHQPRLGGGFQQPQQNPRGFPHTGTHSRFSWGRGRALPPGNRNDDATSQSREYSS